MKKIFVIFIAFSLFISSLCAITGCTTEDNNVCSECEEGYLKMTNGAKCVHACADQENNACKESDEGYELTLAGTCIKGCKTADTETDSAKCKTCTTEANLSTDGLSCIANCKTTGINSVVCSECASGYTLSTDKVSCTAEAKKEDDTKEDDKSSSFGLYNSLLIFALLLLF